MRHLWLYMRGIIPFARLSPAFLGDKARDHVGKLEEIGHSEHPAALAENDLWIGCDHVGPLPRYRADALLVDA